MAKFLKKQTNVPRRRQGLSQVNEHPDSKDDYTFRRNRTLTGSLSSRIATVNEGNAQLKSARVQAHELTRQRRHIGLTLLLVAVAAGVLYFLISQFTASVVIRTQDLSMNLDPSYEQIVQSYFASQPIERFRFLVSADHLSEYVESKAPEIASIKVEGSAGFGKSEFVVTIRKPIAGWSIGGQQQYVDATGTSFVRNYFASPEVQIVDESGVQVQAGQAVASSRFLGFVGRSVGIAKVYGYKVNKVIIPQGTTRQVELRVDGVGYPIKLSIDRPAGEQIEDMANVLRWLKGRNLSPQYVDVRVSGKAYYR